MSSTDHTSGRSLGQAGHHLQQTVISACCASALPVQMDTYKLTRADSMHSPQGISQAGTSPGDRDHGVSANVTSWETEAQQAELSQWKAAVCLSTAEGSGSAIISCSGGLPVTVTARLIIIFFYPKPCCQLV